ncbi:odontogenic ameloblast-associated protein [Peromyscus maniculatus bairdii]|uniref:odontogenic ameloblast-associated protein n=1 Tax=Peromyscus maniculatus bairdii TaxID=230844 RepID=UPI00077DE580|nr:odontogenic ameloblast-associated protein [Peromyscus maniculatus bairdii]
MKIIILLGLIGATSSAPLVSQRLLSASNSHELLLNLNNGQLLPLQFQSAFNSWIPSFPGFLQQQQQQQQQQAQVPGRPQFPLSTLESLAGLFPNQLPFSGQVGLAPGGQAGQPELLQLQTPPQPQQGVNLMSYVVPFKVPQDQTQMLGYYPVYMLLPWEQPQQAVTASPQQTGPQLFEEQIPFYNQFGYIPQQAEPDVQGGQQHLAFESFVGTAPETPGMPTEGGPLYSQREPVNFKRDNAGVFMPSTSPKPSTDHVFTSALDPTIAPILPEQKAKTDHLREP